MNLSEWTLSPSPRRFLCQEPRVGRSRRGGGPHSPPQKVVIFKEEEEERDDDEDDENGEEEDAEAEAFSPQSSPSSVEDAVATQQMRELPYLATTDMYLCCWQPPPTSSSPWRDPSPTQEDTVDGACLSPYSLPLTSLTNTSIIFTLESVCSDSFAIQILSLNITALVLIWELFYFFIDQ